MRTISADVHYTTTHRSQVGEYRGAFCANCGSPALYVFSDVGGLYAKFFACLSCNRVFTDIFTGRAATDKERHLIAATELEVAKGGGTI